MIPRDKAKKMFKEDVNAYGCPKKVMSKIDMIYDSFEEMDLREFLLIHPDQEMVLRSCLHFLGDGAQEWYENNKI